MSLLCSEYRKSGKAMWLISAVLVLFCIIHSDFLTDLTHFFVFFQSEDPGVHWQLNLYKDVVVKSEESANPENSVERIQSISAAVFHLDQVKAQFSISAFRIGQ